MMDLNIREFGPSIRVRFAKHLVAIVCFDSTFVLLSYEYYCLGFAIGYLLRIMDTCLPRDWKSYSRLSERDSMGWTRLCSWISRMQVEEVLAIWLWIMKC